jgi:RNA-directed DNA polymerase
MLKLRDSIRSKTRRSDGRMLQVIIADVNRTLRGWFEYFKHSLRHVFLRVDKWVRGRLRSPLRKRHQHRGMATWGDQQRWPNAYFAGQGLISLKQDHARARQSVKAAH